MSSESSGDDEDAGFVYKGECAMDLFIDPVNPFGKATHSSLQSKIIEQKKIVAERLAAEMRRQRQERELRKLRRRLTNIRRQRQNAEKRKQLLDTRLEKVKERKEAYRLRQEAWRAEIELKYEEELALTGPLEAECARLRDILGVNQGLRFNAFRTRLDPIIIRDEPSTKANFKMQAKYLQYEVVPLAQRLRITRLRLDGETLKRKRVEEEVKQLRERITEQNSRIAALTKGVPISRTMLSKISDHKKRWRRICRAVIMTKAAVDNN